MSYFFTDHFRQALFDDPTLMDTATVQIKLLRVAPSLASPAASQWLTAATMEELTSYIGWEEVIGIGGYPEDLPTQDVSVRTVVDPQTESISHYVLFNEYPFEGLDEPALIEGFGIEYVGDLNGITNPLIFVTNTPVGTYTNLDPGDKLVANENLTLGDTANRSMFSWADPEPEATSLNLIEGRLAILRAPPLFEASNTMHIWLYPQRANMIANPSFEADISQWAPEPVRVREAPFMPDLAGEVPTTADLLTIVDPEVGDKYAVDADDHIWEFLGPDPDDPDAEEWKDLGAPTGGGWCGHFTKDGQDPMAIESNVWETRMGYSDHEWWTFQLMAKGTGKVKVGLISWDLDYRASSQDWGTETWLLTGGWTHITCVRNGPQAHTAMMRIEAISGGDAQELKIDHVLAERGALREYPYFDGDERYGAVDDYSWYGGAGRRGTSYSMWYGGRRAVIGRLFATPTDTESVEDVVTNVDVMAAGMVYEWVPAGVTVIPHLDVFYPTDLRGPLPPRREEVLPPAGPDDPLGVDSPWEPEDLPPVPTGSYPMQMNWYEHEGDEFAFDPWFFQVHDPDFVDPELEFIMITDYVITDQGIVLDPTYDFAMISAAATSALTTNYSMAAAFDLGPDSNISIDSYLVTATDLGYAAAGAMFVDNTLYFSVNYDESSGVTSATTFSVPWTPVGTRVYLALTVLGNEATGYAWDSDEGFFWHFTLDGAPILPPLIINQPVINIKALDGVYGSYWTEAAVSEAQLLTVITEWGYGGGSAGEGANPPSVTINVAGTEEPS